MRKLLVLFASLTISLSACGQTRNEAVSALRQGLVETNKQLPITAAFFTMERMEIKGNDYIIHATIDENQMDLDQYIANMNQNKSNLFSLAAGNNKDFADLFAKSGLNLKFSVTGKQSKRKGEILLSAREINAPTTGNYNAKEYMKEMVAEMQNDLPEDWGDGLTLTSVFIEDNYICYKIKTDNSMITIALLKKAKADGTEMEESIIEELNSMTDASEKLFVNYLRNSGMGVKYIYWSSNPSDKVSFSVSPAMIKARVKEQKYY